MCYVALDTHINHIDTVQAGISTGLIGLKNLSMIGLGLGAVQVAVIAGGLLYLKKRHDQLKKEIKKLGRKMELPIEAELDAGVNYLESADRAKEITKRTYDYNKAIESARKAGHYFRSLALSQEFSGDNFSLIQFYSRKYFLALSIELGSLLALGDTDSVKACVDKQEDNLKAVASAVFKNTIEEKVESYLAPELRNVASLESISGILAQAQNLGCMSSDIRVTPAVVFETNRVNIYSGRRPGFLRWVTKSDREDAAQKLQAAQATFEEVTRLLSWREAVGYLATNGRSPTEIAREVRSFCDTEQERIKKEEKPNASPSFVAYSVSPNHA